MNGKCTPGPWIAAAKPSSVVGWPIVAATGRVVASVAHLTNAHVGAEGFNAESYANALLMSAAPDLLKALEKAAAQFDEYAALHAAKPDWAKAVKNLAMAELCRVAIAKATAR